MFARTRNRGRAHCVLTMRTVYVLASRRRPLLTYLLSYLLTDLLTYLLTYLLTFLLTY